MLIRRLPRLWGRSTPPQAGEEAPPEPEVCFTEQDVVELAEMLFQERVRRATPDPGPRKFTPIVIANDLRLCYVQQEIDGVTRRVRVPCPMP